MINFICGLVKAVKNGCRFYNTPITLIIIEFKKLKIVVYIFNHEVVFLSANIIYRNIIMAFGNEMKEIQELLQVLLINYYQYEKINIYTLLEFFRLHLFYF